MLKISAEQGAIFDAQVEADFIHHACRLLRVHAQDDLVHLDDAGLAQFVRDSRTLAAQFGVTGEQGILKWALIRILAGYNFHEIPEVEAFFSRERDADHAVKLLYDRLARLEQQRRS